MQFVKLDENNFISKKTPLFDCSMNRTHFQTENNLRLSFQSESLVSGTELRDH